MAAGGALREILAHFGIEVDGEKLERADDRIKGVIATVKGLGQALAGGLLVHAFQGFVASAVHTGEELTFLSRRLGLSTDDLQRWQLAARLSAVPAEALTTAIGRMQRAAVAASDPQDELAQQFKKLGVEVRGADGQIKGTDQLFTEVGNAIGALPDPALRTAAAFRIFGRGGAQLLPLFSQGAEGLAAMKAELDELGGGFSEEFVEAAHEAGKEEARFDVALQGLRSFVALNLLPTVSRFVRWLTHMAVGFKKLVEHSNIVKAAFVVLGTVLTAVAFKVAAAFAPAVLAALGVVVPIALLVVLVDELITTLQGGDTALGAFLVGLGLFEDKEQYVREMSSAWADLKGFVSDAATATGDFLSYIVDDRWPQFVEDSKKGWTGIRDFGVAAWEWIKAAFMSMWDVVGPVYREIRDFIRGGAPSAPGEREAVQRALEAGAGFASAGAAPAPARPGGGSSSEAVTNALWANQGRMLAGSRVNTVTIGNTVFNLTVQEAFNAQQTARQIRAQMEEFTRIQHEEALAALVPEVPGSGFEDEVQLEAGGD